MIQTFPTKPRKRASLVDTVVEGIQQFIREQGLAAEDRLPTEQELCTRMGVSRTVMREALGRLQTLGLVSIQRGRGMFVGNASGLSSCLDAMTTAISISAKELTGFNEFRAAIECHAARRAAELATDAEILQLQELLGRMAAHPESRDALQADLQFHCQIVALARNELLAHAMQVIQQFVLAGILGTMDGDDPAEELIDLAVHRAIFEAIRDRDPDRAARAMLAHMESLNRRLVALEQKRQLRN